MADNSLGFALSGFMNSFNASRQNRDNKKLQDELIKAQTKLTEIQLKKAATEQEAAGRAQQGVSRVDQMMSGRQQSSTNPALSAPLWEQAPGPNGAPDPLGEMQHARPKGLIDMMVDPQGQAAMMQAGYLTPKDLMGGASSGPKELQIAAALGIDLSTPEGQDKFKQFFYGGDPAIAALSETIRLQNAQGTQQDAEEARAKRKEDQEVADKMAVINVRQNFQHAGEIYRLQKQLEGSLQAVGIPGGDWMQIGSKLYDAGAKAAGFDDKKRARDIQARDRLIKLYENGVIEGMDRFVGSGSVSQGKYESLQKASANVGNSPGANNLLLADSLEAQLWAAEAEGLDVPNADEILSFIEELRAEDPDQGAASPNPIVDGPGTLDKITGMSEELAADVAQITKMGAEELKAFSSTVDLKEAPQEILKALEVQWDKVMQGAK